MVRPQAARTWSITSGLSGSPAPQTSRKLTLKSDSRSWMNSRHTVGGAHSVVTPQRAIVASRPFASKRGWLTTNTVAPAFHGAKKQLHACFAQPGEEMLRWTSPGCRPSQYMVDKAPTGELRWLCRTSFGFAVVPEVK